MHNTKNSSTKKSLVLSALSLMLCFAMLLGTTYAWFTDSVTSGKNRIVAGNLDVELTHSNALVSDETVQDSTDLFKFEKVGGTYKEVLWEPGMVVYENFTVSNVGNLALKYALSLNVFDKNKTTAGNDLTEVIKVATYNGELTATTRDALLATNGLSAFTTLADFQKNGKLAGKSGTTVYSNTYGVVLYWEPTDHDNDYNLKNGLESDDGEPLFVEFGVNLVATQDTVEADSFDTLYDATAPLAVMSTPMTELLSGTESLKIVVPEAAQSSVKEATVPAAVANAIFGKVFEDSTATDKSLTLVLNVEKKGEKQTETDTAIKTEINYAIDMDAVIKEIAGDTVTSETKSIDELNLTFDDFVEVQMTIDSNLSEVVVKHNGNPMTGVADKAGIASADNDPDGYFHYDEATGALTLWTKTFSPFTVEGKVMMTYTRDTALNKCRHTHTKTIGTTTDGKYDCTDGNGDDICDFCKESMIVEVYSVDDFAYTNSWYRANPGNTKYKLMQDITCTNCIFFSSGTTLDMNGHTFTHNGSYWSVYSNVAKTVLNITDSSTGEQKGKLVCKNFLFDLTNNELDVNVSGGVIIDATQFASSIFRISNNTNKPVVKVTGADMAVGQLLLAQGSCDITFKDCKVTSTDDGIVQVIPQSKSNDMDIKFENCELISTATSYSEGVIFMQNNNGNNNTCTVTVKDSTVSIGGGYAIYTRNQLVLDHATITGGTIQTFSGSSVTYKNNTTVNGVVQPNTAE